MQLAAAALLCFSQLAYAQLSPVESAEQSFSKGKYDRAYDLYLEITKNPFASPRDISLSQCRLGIITSIKNHNDDSRHFLESSLASGALPKAQSTLCQYALLQIYVLSNANTEARDLIKKMGEPGFAPTYVARIWALAVEVGHRMNDSRFEVIYLQKLYNIMERNKLDFVEVKLLGNRKITISEVRKRLGEDSEDQKNKTHTEEPVVAASPVPTEVPVAAVAAAAPATNSVPSSIEEILLQKLNRSEYTDALALIEKLRTTGAAAAYPLDGYGLHISLDALEHRVKRMLVDKPRDMRIGILLPAGSPFTRFNSKVLRAVSAFTGSSAIQGVNFSYIVRVVPADPGAAEAAALAMIFEDDVHAILGPISAAQAVGAVRMADLFAVPMFALGPIVDAPELSSPALTRMGMLARSQAEVLVNHLKADLGLGSASILAPDDAYGFEMARAFAKVCSEKSVKVTRTAWFDVSSTVVKDSVTEVLGPQDIDSRRAEFETAAADLRKKAELERRKFDPADVKLPAKLDFDVLFIPDSLPRAKIIATTFAFYDAREIRYFGDRQWHEGAGRPSMADEFLNSARVPSLAVGNFMEYLQNSLNSGDSTLDLERQAFDALIMLRQAQYKAGGANGTHLCAALREPQFSAEGTSLYGAVDSTGEPRVRFAMESYRNGKLLPQLFPWKFATINNANGAAQKHPEN